MVWFWVFFGQTGHNILKPVVIQLGFTHPSPLVKKLNMDGSGDTDRIFKTMQTWNWSCAFQQGLRLHSNMTEAPKQRRHGIGHEYRWAKLTVKLSKVVIERNPCKW